MKKLNKSTTYAILWLNYCGKNTEEISIELSISPDSVIRVIEKNFSNSKDNKIKTNTKPVSTLMINKSQIKESPVSIMTKEASEKNDSLKNSHSINNKYSKNIHKIL